MHLHGDIFLCDYRGARLYAVLDELTLTYDIVQRGPGGAVRPLRRHVRSLPDARRWACALTAARSG